MKNIKLFKSLGKGWVLHIADEFIINEMALTSVELWGLQKVINDAMPEIMEEIENRDPKE